MKRLLLVTLILALIIPLCQAPSVGVSPGYKYFGEVEREASRTAELYITTTAQTPFEVKPEFEPPLHSDVFEERGMTVPGKVSEEKIKPWIRFEQDSFVVDPRNESVSRLGDGTPVKHSGKVTFTIDVPHNAEPGYHAGKIKLNPVFGEAGEGFGARVVGEAVFRFSFKVPGPAMRRLEITDIQAIRTGPEEVRIDTFVKNTGTVTTTLKTGKAKIIDGSGEKIGAMYLGGEVIKPKETRVLTDYWRSDKIQGGQYQFDGKLSYITGAMSLGDVFSIPQQIEIVPPDRTAPGEEPQREKFPIWLVLMILSVLGVLMYSFEIDPVMIFFSIGVLGISSYIFLTGLSNLYIIVLVGIAGGILYYYF